MSYEDLARLGVTFRPIDRWPGTLRSWEERTVARFSASLTQTMETLERELRLLKAERIVVQIAVTERDIRLDGFPYARAKAEHPGVILAFDSRFGSLQYPTDAFLSWEDNLRGVALSMEALRAVDRYGVSKRGEQYTGWKALPAGSQELADEIETPADAQAFLDLHGGSYTSAVKVLHPDVGGDDELFRAATKARDVLRTLVHPRIDGDAAADQLRVRSTRRT